MTRKLLASGQRRMKMREIGKAILSEIAGSVDRLSVSLEDFKVKNTTAKATFKVVAASEYSKADILSAINEKFGGKLRAVARSFRLTENSSADASNVMCHIEGYLVPNVEVIEAHSERGKVMSCVASNMFMDDADCIWNKSGDFLYKKSDVETSEQLEAMLSEVSSEGGFARQRKANDFKITTPSAGSFISFTHQGEMGYGFVVATDTSNKKLMVLADGEDEPEVIDDFQVKDQYEVDGDELRQPEEVECSSDSVSVDKLVQYYKRVYSYNQPFLDGLIGRIKGYSFI